MDDLSVICSEKKPHGEWLDIAFTDFPSEAHRSELVVLYCGEFPIRRSSDGVQVLCQGGHDAEDASALANQILADIALRDRIAERSVVLMNDLVEGVLCSVMKS